ncbi:response regulator transcription factor [Sphaerobacter sp.]|uniref:response regulator transcription factor n=1 Tax=Sphaerobacter sp. TaxID=2099654 RepID=UPI001D9940B5|nr:response regulator transcription factor [Sphaerobacter sp.]MBX5445331.1 response regulator transcription factor [Sphaerobacter sp.]
MARSSRNVHSTGVLIVDDHPLFRQGLRRLIEDEAGLHVVAEASNGYKAMQQADVYRPALALVDVQLPGVTGLNVVRALKEEYPHVRAIVLSTYQSDDLVLAALQAGAAAFATKDVVPELLLDTIQRVLRGERPIDTIIVSRPALARRLLLELRAGAPGEREGAPPAQSLLPLSPREMEVLDCVAQGLSNKEIADTLYITEQTVKNHITAVYRKLHVQDRVEALTCAVRRGWVQIGSAAPTTV